MHEWGRGSDQSSGAHHVEHGDWMGREFKWLDSWCTDSFFYKGMHEIMNDTCTDVETRVKLDY